MKLQDLETVRQLRDELEQHDKVLNNWGRVECKAYAYTKDKTWLAGITLSQPEDRAAVLVVVKAARERIAVKLRALGVEVA